MNKYHLPDFKSHEERDNYFREHADYFSLVSKAGVGNYTRYEYKTLAEAEAAAQTKQTIGGGGWLIYSVIGEQSALAKAIKK